jgi:hypothetical protein
MKSNLTFLVSSICTCGTQRRPVFLWGPLSELNQKRGQLVGGKHILLGLIRAAGGRQVDTACASTRQPSRVPRSGGTGNIPSRAGSNAALQDYAAQLTEDASAALEATRNWYYLYDVLCKGAAEVGLAPVDSIGWRSTTDSVRSKTKTDSIAIP